ncbi:MAG: hypothetical protein J2P25_00990 [Nocardiopsaceae bacterium]|nr:hypothetical protein [Nocardiopsaceae bacterium]
MLDVMMRGLADGTVTPEPDAPEGARPWLDDLLSKADTYRDAALIVLAYAVDAGSVAGVAKPPSGRRTVAQRFAGLMDELNIRAKRDAFQTLAKGTNSLLGRNRNSWNRLLGWALEQGAIEPVEQAMRYMASRIAATARDLQPMPALDVSLLSFRRVVRVADSLLDRPSGGAHQQFVFAAMLHAQAEEYGHRRVETKTLNATDASAGTAADVQVLDGGRVTEAYEVTANPWESKIAQALAVLRDHDLPRIHIVAPGPAPSGDEIADAVEGARVPSGLIAANVDLSVLDIRHECRSLVHRLTRPGRRSALNALWPRGSRTTRSLMPT